MNIGTHLFIFYDFCGLLLLPFTNLPGKPFAAINMYSFWRNCSNDCSRPNKFYIQGLWIGVCCKEPIYQLKFSTEGHLFFLQRIQYKLWFFFKIWSLCDVWLSHYILSMMTVRLSNSKDFVDFQATQRWREFMSILVFVITSEPIELQWCAWSWIKDNWM